MNVEGDYQLDSRASNIACKQALIISTVAQAFLLLRGTEYDVLGKVSQRRVWKGVLH